MMRGGSPPAALLGRQRELRHISRLIDAVPSAGGVLLLRGEAGIGKSALLATANGRAESSRQPPPATDGPCLAAYPPNVDALPVSDIGPETADDLCTGPTFAWWAIRIEFAVAIAAIVFAAWTLIVFPPWLSIDVGDNLGLRTGVLPYLGFIAMIAGFARMVRIYHDLRRQPASSWRYRDRR